MIATKLSFSPTARREVESLKKTWELLEYLPRPKASEDFPDRTFTSLRSLDAKRMSWERATSGWLGPAARLALSLAVAAASIAAGFALTRWVWPDPAVRMARELSLAEHLGEYQEVGSFDFLQELAKSKEFGAPSH